MLYEVITITFGSCTGPVREAFARAKDDGLHARLISLRLLSPVQPERLASALAGVKRALVIEQNHGAQFLRYLRAEYDIAAQLVITSYSIHYTKLYDRARRPRSRFRPR